MKDVKSSTMVARKKDVARDDAVRYCLTTQKLYQKQTARNQAADQEHGWEEQMTRDRQYRERESPSRAFGQRRRSGGR